MEKREERNKPNIHGFLNSAEENRENLVGTSHLSRRSLSRWLGAIAIPAFIVIILTLAILNITAAFEPPLLLPILNMVFVAAVSFAVAYISARCYLTMGLPNILLLGCGVLTFGAGNLVAGWLITSPGAPNVNVIIHNTGALLGSLFHAVGAMLALPGITTGKVSKRRKFGVILTYLGVLVFMALLTIASLREAIPPFFIHGVGPTPLRQVVLGAAVALFAISSFLFMKRYSKLKVDFLYWYSLALALIAVGLSAVFLQPAVGSPIGWAGRSAQYLGGIYFFIAVLTTIRGARARGIPLEIAIANFFREAQKHYGALIETVSDAIISIDHETRVLLWNSAAEKMFGYSRGETVGSFLTDLIVPDHCADSLRKDFAKGENNPLIGETTEIEAKRKDGKVFPAELSVSARKTPGGWISTIIVRDISERKMAERALRKSEEKYRQLIENLQEGIWVIDKDSYTTFVNPRMAEMLGYTTDEMIGKALFSFMDNHGVEIAQGFLNRRKQGIKEQHDFEFLRKDGTRLYATLETTPIFDSEGNYFGAIAGVMDISRRKRAEEALRLSEERYALAQRVANIGSWDWDIRTGNLKWSEKIEPMFGFGPGEFGGTYEAFLECVHPEDRQHVVDSVNACIQEGKNYDIDHRIVWPDNTVRWVSETGNVIRDKNNKAIRMLGVVKDITERKQAEEILKRDKETFEKLVNERTQELLKAQAELDKAKRLSDLGTLAATVAHELRNPLGVIRTASYNIRRKRENSILDRHLDNIEKKISESDQIINNLLSYSRIKIPSYEKIQIYDILNECIALMKRRFYKQNVSILKKIVPAKKKLIEADPLQIREIFNNILINAYQSISDKKGKIEIMVRHNEKGSIEISFKDNGEGIDKEDLERVFEPFFTRKSKGTGLGLTICNELVNLHSGKIKIESKKGEGTTVRVTLPIERVTK